MASEEMQILDITANAEDPEEGTYNILQVIRPEWKRSQIEIKVFTEGYINHMMCCNLKSDSNKDEAVIVRIFGGIKFNGEMVTLGADNQIMAMQMASSLGIAEPIYAIFKNGIVYKYAAGRTLDAADVQNPKIIRLMCRTLATFHHAKWDTTKLYKISGEKQYIEKKTVPMMTKEKAIELLQTMSETFDDAQKQALRESIFPPKDEIINEYIKARERMDKIIPKILQHNDFHIKNMVYNPEKGKLTLLDYEVVGSHWTGADLARLFCMAPMWKELGFTDENYIFKEEELLPYVKAYLEERNILLGKGPDSVTELEVNTLYWQVRMCWAFSDFMQSIMMLVMVDKKVEARKKFDMDTLELAIRHYNLFMPKKDFFYNSSPPME